MIRFDSDYLEGCIPEILEELAKTNYEQTPGYGEDDYCTEAKKVIRDVCSAPEADVHFLVGGTQTNVTVISFLLKPYQGVISASTGHINVHETGAVEHSGHKVIALESSDGKVTAEGVERIMQDHANDCSREHTAQPGMVYISFPTERGTIYSKKELSDISGVCRKWGILLFVDGARLGYGLCSPESDITIKDLASLADVFYIGGTKQGALFGEAVVFRNQSLSKDFRYSIKQNGGMLAKGRLLGLQYKVLFESGLYFKYSEGAITKALRIKEAFASRGTEFLVDSPTNQQFPILSNEKIAFLRQRFSFEDWERIDSAHTAVRFCTSWATTDTAVDALIASL